MRKLKDLNYGIVGLGIMGGSIAKAIRQNILSQNGSSGKIYACNRSTACLSQAKSEGVVDYTFTSDKVQDMIADCDILYVCLYPHATIDFLKNYKQLFKPDSIVTYISGVKGIFAKELPNILRDDVDFIIGHPMAGGEKEGYANSNAAFFVNHNYILCPEKFNKAENIELMKKFITEIGFSRITFKYCISDRHKFRK